MHFEMKWDDHGLGSARDRATELGEAAFAHNQNRDASGRGFDV